MTAVASYLAQYFIPGMKNLYLDIIIRSAVMSVVFISLTLGLRISPEVNERFRWIAAKILKKY
jgi:hypothetical protein